MQILNIPPTKNPGQRSMGYEDAYLAKFIPSWYRPPTYDGNAWRAVVEAQPVATTCKESLIASVLSLDWKITVKYSEMREDLQATVKYYTRLFEKTGYGLDMDYSSHIEWISSDLLDTPFGGAAEVGRKDDSPMGRVQWVEPLDSATLYPTLNSDFPVIQMYAGNQIAFPRHAIARSYLSPRTRIEFKGWGMSPPEKAYLALNMLARGDTYYANLLLDIPTTGILDLGDMEKESALEWVQAYQALLSNGGNSSFKVPVLYEHQNDIKFVPFGKVPNDIMFDRISLKYASLVTAAYGVSLSDIGISTSSNGGDTMAGSIRGERKTRKTGFARLKKKLQFYFNSILPPTLEFRFIDYDDEANVALGRARLATSTAFKLLAEGGFITPDEGRQQIIADGIMTINMGEKAPGVPKVQSKPVAQPNIGDTIGKPVPVSMGGHGEIKKFIIVPSDIELKSVVLDMLQTMYPQMQEVREAFGEDNLFEAKASIEQNVIPYFGTINSGWLQPAEEVYKDEIPVLERLVQDLVLSELKDIVLTDEDIDFSDNNVYHLTLETIVGKIKDNFDEIVSTAMSTHINKELV